MLRYVLVFSIMVAATAASGNPAKQSVLRGAKSLVSQALPAGLKNKAITAALAASLLLGQAPAALAVQESGSDSALQQSVEQETVQDGFWDSDWDGESNIAWKAELRRLMGAQVDVREVLLVLQDMKAYERDFAVTVADGRAKLKEMLAAAQALRMSLTVAGYTEDEVPSAAASVLQTNDEIKSEFERLDKGLEGLPRDGINWVAKRTQQERRVGLDYRDVEHYRQVKHTLTAADYDGVSIHYFVDGLSFRGVAKAIHPELKIRVRVGTEIIDVAQISGVLIVNSPHNIVNSPHKSRKRTNFKEDRLVEPHDPRSYLPDDHDGKDDLAAGAALTWDGIVFMDEFYSDGYAKFNVWYALIKRRRPEPWPDNGPWSVGTFVTGDNHIYNGLINYENLPVPTAVIRKNIALDKYENDIFVSAYGDEQGALGIIDSTYIPYYQQVKDQFTAADYQDAVVLYRAGADNRIAQVGSPHEDVDDGMAVVFDLDTDTERVIALADIQGVLLAKHPDYGIPATIRVGTTAHYGEVFLAFSNDELTVLIHAVHRGDGKVELVDDKYTVTVPRSDAGLILHSDTSLQAALALWLEQ